MHTSSRWLPCLTATLLAASSGCPAPSSPPAPGTAPPPGSPSSAATQPRPTGPRVEAIPPKADDLDEFDTRPGIQVKAWRYTGPSQDIRFTVSVDDDTSPGWDNDTL